MLETVLLAFLCLGMVFVVISENKNRKYFPYVKQAPDFQFPQTCAAMCNKQHAPCYDICHGCYFQVNLNA